jgi:hypothetical protein
MNVSPKYLVLGLTLGILDSQDVQSWVNDEIANESNPSEELIELAFTKDNDVHGLISILSLLPDSKNEYEIVRHLLGKVTTVNQANIEYCRRLAECLYNFWVQMDYEAPDDLTEIGFLDDAYSLADTGTYGTMDEWHNDFKKFISTFKTDY